MISQLAASKFPGLVLKAWVLFEGATGAITKQSNVTSVTKNGVGNYTINFTVPLATATFLVVGENITASVGAKPLVAVNARTTGTCQVLAVTNSALADGTQYVEIYE